MARRVLITRELPEAALEFARRNLDVAIPEGNQALSREELIKQISDKEGLVSLLTDTIDEEVLSAAPGLKVVSNVAVGFNNIDVSACTRRGVWVTNTPGILTETTADFTWVLLLATARRVVEGDRYVRAGKFKVPLAYERQGGVINGATIGGSRRVSVNRHPRVGVRSTTGLGIHAHEVNRL